MASSSTFKVVASAIGGNGFITIIKFIGTFFTASPSMMAEAVHSLADTFNQVLLLIGIKHSEGEKSGLYPYGKGQARYMWNLISAVGVFFIGFGVTAYHGIHNLISPPKNPDFTINYISLGILAISFIIEGAVFILAYKEVKKQQRNKSFFKSLEESDDPTTIAILFEDGIALFGVTLAILGSFLSVYFKSTLPDAICSILIAILLGVMAIFLGAVNSRLLLGKSITEKDQENIKSFLLEKDFIKNIIQFHTTIMGPGDVRLSLEVEIDTSKFIDAQIITENSTKLKSGSDPAPILWSMSETMIRKVGHQINQIEQQVYKEFPLVKSIDFEIG